MTEPRLSADYVSYLDAAAAIFSRHSGRAAVAAFGLDDVFSEAGTVDLAPAYAFLEAQGRCAVTTPALGQLALAQCPPFDVPAGELGFGLPFGRGALVAVPGMADTTCVVLDRARTGLVIVTDTVDVRPDVQDLADDYLRVLDGSAAATTVVVPEAKMAGVRPVLRARVQLGASAELLGVCERLLEDAVAYAKTRRQFGSSIGSYQSVQHLLAWASTEVHQLRCLFDIVVHQSTHTSVDPLTAQTVKAMAGRTLHSVAQTAIQVTGAISFTWEYSLNRLHHRGLLLDQLAGPSADLVAELGQYVRLGGVVPALVELGELSA